MIRPLNLLLAADGVLFSVSALVTFATADPRRALTRQTDAGARAALADTRRVLAASLAGTGTATFVLGASVTDAHVLRFGALMRLTGLALLAIAHGAAAVRGHFKRAPSLFGVAACAALAILYVLGLATLKF